jgi:tRNA pseudouridine55 synthase
MTEAPMNQGAAPTGVLNALKPSGMTSHDVVDHARRVLGTRRVGHAGTLDPGACGVLVLCVGAATRIVEFLTDQSKEYRSEFTFGVATDSGDAYGATLRESDAGALSADVVSAALAGFVGEQDQVPPMVSAVQKGGRRLYELARRGEIVHVDPRRITVTECRLISFTPGPRATAMVHIACSKGTYVRAIARDLGERLGCGAHASFVLRTRAGRFHVSDSVTLEDLQASVADRRAETFLQTMDDALSEMPAVDLTPSQRQNILDGRPLTVFTIPGWAQLPVGSPIRLRDSHGLMALARIEEGRLQPFRVLRGASV